MTSTAMRHGTRRGPDADDGRRDVPQFLGVVHGDGDSPDGITSNPPVTKAAAPSITYTSASGAKAIGQPAKPWRHVVQRDDDGARSSLRRGKPYAMARRERDDVVDDELLDPEAEPGRGAAAISARRDPVRRQTSTPRHMTVPASNVMTISAFALRLQSTNDGGPDEQNAVASHAIASRKEPLDEDELQADERDEAEERDALERDDARTGDGKYRRSRA